MLSNFISLLYKNPRAQQQRALQGEPASKWLGASVAIPFASENKNWEIFGGCWAGSKEQRQKDYAMLQEKFSIGSQDNLLDKIDELLEVGDRFSYNLSMQQYERRGFFELSRWQISSDETFPHISLYQRRWLYDMMHGYQRYGERSLLGYDISRAIYVTQTGFMAGHLSMDRALKISLQAAEMLQQNFSGWQELTDSYLLGYAYQTQEDKQNPASKLANQIRVAEMLRWEGCPIAKSKPYETDWNTPLKIQNP